jgi:hypothetical protein
MFHLYQKPIFECLRDFRVIGGEPIRHDLPERRQLFIVDVVAFILGEPEEKDCTIRPECDQHPKAASLALARPGDPLLDKAAAEISINQPTLCRFESRLRGFHR